MGSKKNNKDRKYLMLGTGMRSRTQIFLHIVTLRRNALAQSLMDRCGFGELNLKKIMHKGTRISAE